jgi:hypothetical protein
MTAVAGDVPGQLLQSRYQRHIHEHMEKHFDAVAERLRYPV